ncbi:hypothetical protein ACUL41_17785 [Virgibacillus natechei]
MSNDNRWLHDLRNAFITYNNEEFDVTLDDELLTLATANDLTEASTVSVGYTSIDDYEEYELAAVIDLNQKQLITTVQGANYEEKEVMQYQSYQAIIDDLKTCSFDDFMRNDLDYDKIIEKDKEMEWQNKTNDEGDRYDLTNRNISKEEFTSGKIEAQRLQQETEKNVELHTYDGTIEIDTEWLKDNIEGMEIDEFLQTYTWDEAEWLYDEYAKEQREKRISKKAEPDMDM